MEQTLLRRNLIARTSGEHLHTYPQLLLGCKGVTECEFDRSGLGIGPDNMAIVPSHEQHGYAGRNEDSELLVIDIKFDDPALQLLESRADKPLNKHIFVGPRFLNMPPSLRSLVSHAAWQLNKTEMTRPVRQMLAQQWALMLITQVYQSLEALPGELNRREQVNPALLNRLIDQQLATPLDNKYLAHRLNMSLSRLHNVFQTEFEMTPQKYVMQRRMQWARHWLSQGCKPIGVIALDLGFADTASFSHAFHRYCGCSPSQYYAEA